MPASTAATESPPIVDNHVSNLACCPRRASAQFAIRDDARANPCADEDADEVARMTASPKVLFAIGGDLHIVADHYGDVKRLAEQFTQRQVVKPFSKVRSGN